MTSVLAAATLPRMGRKRLWREDMQARFPEGTFRRMREFLTKQKIELTSFAKPSSANSNAARPLRGEGQGASGVGHDQRVHQQLGEDAGAASCGWI